MNLDEAKKIVEEFNEQNRYRDGGRINTAIKTVLEELENIETNYETLQADIEQVIKDLRLPDDMIIVDEFVSEINKKYIPKSKIEDKIKELKEKCKKEYDTGCTYCWNGCRYYSRCELCKELLRGEE